MKYIKSIMLFESSEADKVKHLLKFHTEVLDVISNILEQLEYDGFQVNRTYNAYVDKRPQLQLGYRIMKSSSDPFGILEVRPTLDHLISYLVESGQKISYINLTDSRGNILHIEHMDIFKYNLNLDLVEVDANINVIYISIIIE